MLQAVSRVGRGAGERYLSFAHAARLGENPETHLLGWHWGTMTHEILVVDWEGSDGRYLVDGGESKGPDRREDAKLT